MPESGDARECCSTAARTKSSTVSVRLRGGMAESFGARLHVLYTVEEPLSAGWTAEVSAERLPEVHDAMEIEAQERLARADSGRGSGAARRRFGLRTGPEARGNRPLHDEEKVDLAIVQVRGRRRRYAAARPRDPREWPLRRADPSVQACRRPAIHDNDRSRSAAVGVRERMVSDGRGMAEIRWFSPDPRGIIPLETFHVPRRLARVVRRRGFRIEIEPGVREPSCARARRRSASGEEPAPGSTTRSARATCALHERGVAHSVEAWQDGRLAGGLYGVALGGAFFGESMFHRRDRRIQGGAGGARGAPAQRGYIAARHPVGRRSISNSSARSRSRAAYSSLGRLERLFSSMLQPLTPLPIARLHRPVRSLAIVGVDRATSQCTV